MKRLDKNGAVLQTVRDEIFLHVWAPVLTEYVEWVLEEALRYGEKRLYFLARDGYMMYLLAKEFVKAKDLDLDIRYLKVSRFAIRRAEYYFSGREALDTLCAGGINVSFETIMKRAGLTKEEAFSIARLAGYGGNYKTGLNHRQLCRLKQELSRIDQLFVYIKKHSGECYDTTVSYLRQEGLLQKIPYALVDSGWIGTLQYSLQRVLAHGSATSVKLQGYYFGIYERPKETAPDQYRAFYFDEKEICRKVRFSNCLFETVFSAPEGMTYGYGASKDGAVYEALECDSRNPNAEVMERFAELLLQYVSCYEAAKDSRKFLHYAAITDRNLIDYVVEKDSNHFRDCVTEGDLSHHENHKKRACFVESLLNSMMGSPTRLEAEAFGELLFCDDVLELQLQPAAPKWEEGELLKRRFLSRILIKMNLKSGSLRECAWAEGSITRFGKMGKKNMRQERLYKRFMYLRKAIGK